MKSSETIRMPGRLHGLTSGGRSRVRGRERRGVDDVGAQARAMREFLPPLLAQSGRHEDEHAIRASARPQLAHQQRRLNRLAETNRIGQQQPRRTAAQHGEDRIDLVRHQRHLRVRNRRGTFGRRRRGDERGARPHPPRARHHTRRSRSFHAPRPIERLEQRARLPPVQRIRANQLQHARPRRRTARERPHLHHAPHTFAHAESDRPPPSSQSTQITGSPPSCRTPIKRILRRFLHVADSRHAASVRMRKPHATQSRRDFARFPSCERRAGWRGSVDQLCNCRAEVRFGGVPEVEDEGVAFEEGLDAGALMTAAAAVNQADFAQAGGVRGGEVFVDERRMSAGAKL